MKFEFVIRLKRGYRKTMEIEETDMLRVSIEAMCRVDADRAMTALLQNATNVENYSGVCIED